MTDQPYFLAEGGRPFLNRGAAESMRQTLLRDDREGAYKVVPHPDGGFAVANVDRKPTSATLGTVERTYEFPEAPREALAREMAATGANAHRADDPPLIGGVLPIMTSYEETNRDRPGSGNPPAEQRSQEPHRPKAFADCFTLRVAPRAFLHLHLATFLGFGLMLFPHWLFAPLGNFGGFHNPMLGASVLGVVRLGGGLVAIVALGKFLYAYLLYRFVVTEDYVEAILGWIARDAPKVFYAHIRTTSVVQSWWERLLIVGSVKIGTGATDRHEVILQHISNPKRIEHELERRYLPFIRSQDRTRSFS